MQRIADAQSLMVHRKHRRMLRAWRTLVLVNQRTRAELDKLRVARLKRLFRAFGRVTRGLRAQRTAAAVVAANHRKAVLAFVRHLFFST